MFSQGPSRNLPLNARSPQEKDGKRRLELEVGIRHAECRASCVFAYAETDGGAPWELAGVSVGRSKLDAFPTDKDEVRLKPPPPAPPPPTLPRRRGELTARAAGAVPARQG